MSAHNEEDDPYEKYKFKVLWEGRYVAGIRKVIGGLKRTTEPVIFKEGGDPSTEIKWPALTFYEAVTLEEGLTQDMEFVEWANAANNPTSDEGESSKDRRRDITIVMQDERGEPVLAFNVYGCRVSKYVTSQDSRVRAGAMAIQTLKLENEGWERIEVVKKNHSEER